MEASYAEMTLAVLKRGKRWRRICSPEERVRLLAEYEASGLTQAAFAQGEGIKDTTLFSWLQRRPGRGRAPEPAGRRPPAQRLTPSLPSATPSPSSIGWPLKSTLPSGESRIMRGMESICRRLE